MLRPRSKTRWPEISKVCNANSIKPYALTSRWQAEKLMPSVKKKSREPNQKNDGQTLGLDHQLKIVYLAQKYELSKLRKYKLPRSDSSSSELHCLLCFSERITLTQGHQGERCYAQQRSGERNACWQTTNTGEGLVAASTITSLAELAGVGSPGYGTSRLKLTVIQLQIQAFRTIRKKVGGRSLKLVGIDFGGLGWGWGGPSGWFP